MIENPQANAEDAPIGWITPVLRHAAFWATYPRRLCTGEHEIPELSATNAAAESLRRARRGDTFLTICFLLDCASLGFIAWNRALGIWLAAPYLVWRILDITGTALRATLFGDFLRTQRGSVKVAPSRVVTLGLLYYLEMALCFGGIYSCWPDLIKSEERDPLTPFHLSFITQLTIGYGDASPLGNLRPVTWVQGMCSIVLLVFLIDKYLGDLQRTRS